MLVLGAPGSGKTTFMWQLKAIFAPHTDAARKFQDFDSAEFHSCSATVDRLVTSRLDVRYALDRSSLRHPVVITRNITYVVASAVSELPLEPSTLHFLDRIVQILAPDYLPTDRDILFCHVDPSPPLDELLLPGSDNGDYFPAVSYVCVRQSIKSLYKWLPTFSNLSDIMFLLNLNDYDDVDHTRMTFELFDLVCTSPFFRRAEIHLIINKPSSFDTKLARCPLDRIYPGAVYGGDQTRAIKFLMSRFNSKQYQNERYIHRWIVDLADTEGMRVTARHIGDAIVRSKLHPVWGVM
ncbi:G-protein alpha subunit-domain-containing protein [Favolaschia claudopus]|uniref:G-protein alpha subunit-domain-containing protein n=1 Tax=Favolaschia claudopus TaxID=2862362 RepID=A0AAW0CN21_9AGAR